MRVLSIDPGYGKLGIAVLDKGGRKDTLVYSACFMTNARTEHPERLRLLGAEIRRCITEYAPEVFAAETLIFNKNHKTVMSVSEARGVALYEAARSNLPVYEYTPLQIKIALTGYGRGEKWQVIRMVQALVDIPEERRAQIKEDDEFDAIAVGVTHLANQ